MPPAASDAQFEVLADAALRSLERAIEASGLDAELDWTGPGVLEIGFANGTRMVINRHGAAREIWVAAKAGGFHFRHDGTFWRDTRDGTELFAAVSRLASAQSGSPVLLSPSA